MFDGPVVEWVQSLDAELGAAGGSAGRRNVGAVPTPEDLERMAPAALARCAATLAPGPETAAFLAAIEVQALDAEGRINMAAATERLIAWAMSRQAEVLVAHAGSDRDCTRSDHLHEQPCSESAIAELSVELRLSERSLGRRWQVAADLATRLPRALAQLSEGTATWGHACALTDETLLMAPGEVWLVHAAVAWTLETATPVRPAGTRGPSSTGSIPPPPSPGAKKLVTDRRVERSAGDGDASSLSVVGPGPDITAMWVALTDLAGPPDATDPRGLDAERFDALLGLCLGVVQPDAAATGDPGSDTDEAKGAGGQPSSGPSGRDRKVRPRTPVTAQVVIDLPTLLGLADNPGHLPGYGPIPAGAARDWLVQAETWQRLVIDPIEGHLLDFGPVVRFAPARLRRFLAARDGGCTFPGCNVSARFCDADHQPRWQPGGGGGSASSHSMALLCRKHHRLVTFGGWSVEERNNGHTVFRSPGGRLSSSSPRSLLPRGP